MTTARRVPVHAALAIATAIALVPSATTVAQEGATAELAPPEAQPLAEARCLPAGDGTGVRIVTAEGEILVGLFNETAPVASENFLNLAQAGYYDGVGFHRLVPGFVIQGGDPDGTGQGGPGYTIADEPVIGTYQRGTVAMARTPQPNSQGSQFFIVLDDEAQGSLESARTYTIFGTVIEGMDVVDRIAAGETRGDGDDTAVDPVAIESIAVEPVTLPEPAPALVPPGGSPLEGSMPATVCGRPLTSSYFAGDDIIANAPEGDPIHELSALAEANGATASDLSVATAETGGGAGMVALLGATLAGVPASDIADELTRALLQLGEAAETEPGVVAGRDVTIVRPGGAEGPTLHVFPSGDVLWFVVAEGDILESVVAALS